MELLFEEESYKSRGAVFEVYKELGCGHKETIYQRALNLALINIGLSVEKEKHLAVIFENKKIGAYIPDFLINTNIILELKAKSIITAQDIQQFWHYLTSTNYKLGFLINFGKPGGVEIIRRVYDKARVKSSA